MRLANLDEVGKYIMDNYFLEPNDASTRQSIIARLQEFIPGATVIDHTSIKDADDLLLRFQFHNTTFDGVWVFDTHTEPKHWMFLGARIGGLRGLNEKTKTKTKWWPFASWWL